MSVLASFRVPAAVTASVGLLLCLAEIMSDGAACPGTTCAVHQAFRPFGISLWWIGLALFCVLLYAAIRDMPALSRHVASAALAIDCPLLLLMTFSVACPGCLAAGVLIALSYVCSLRRSSRPPSSQDAPERRIPVLPAWSVCFLLAIGQLLHESIAPWVIFGPRNPGEMTARVYFSPGCPACRHLVLATPDSDVPTISWCPVAEGEGDVGPIAKMQNDLESGVPFKEALIAASTEAARHVPVRTLPLQIRLLVNHAHVVAGGRNALPFTEFYGNPRSSHRRTPVHRQNKDAEDTFLSPSPPDECKGGPSPCGPSRR